MAPSKAEVACIGKQAFATKTEAERAMKRFGKSSKGRRRNVYRCPVCKRFHIGSSMP